MSHQRKAATLAPSGVLTSREKLWAAMRALKSFSVAELARKAGIDRAKYSIRDYMRGLVNAGIVVVEKAATRPGETWIYALARDMGVDAPRVRRDGRICPETGRAAMWRAMKALGVFTPRDLVANAAMAGREIRLLAAAAYCQWLARGGYLKAPEKPGEPYRFIKDTGPKAPQILRVKQLFDANTGEIVAGQSVAEALDAADGEGEL